MISTSTLLIIFLVYFVLIHIGFYKFFEKAGEPGWKALVPVYSVWVALRIIKKPLWWLFVYYIPFLGIIVGIGIIVEFLKCFGYLRFYQHLLGIVLGAVYLPYIAFKPETKFIGPEAAKKYKKSAAREWADAIVFAVIAATLIRTFFIEAFTIPTSSMEKSLLVGDYLFVSKVSFGAKLPNTPISFPFAHHTLPLTEKTKSYAEWVKLPYYRLPGLSEIKNNDAVVFNYPEGDTVVIQHQNQSYYQLVRELGRDFIWNNFDITVRPVDKRENYIKRCIGIAGDTLTIVDQKVFINGTELPQPPQKQYTYTVITDGSGFSAKTLEKLDITDPIYKNPEIPGAYYVTLTHEKLLKLKSFSFVKEIKREIKEKGHSQRGRSFPIFPNTEQFDWTEDNFGPLYIPEKGGTINLTMDNLPLYKRAINVYEGNDLKVDGNNIYINGEPATSYTFKMNYYFMMGDNRNNSADSRFWGFVPEDHVVGKGVFIWLSLDANKSFLKKVRWDRLMTTIK